MAMQPRYSPSLVGGLRGLELSGGMDSSSASAARLPYLSDLSDSGDSGSGIVSVEHSGDRGSGVISGEPAVPSAVSFRKDPQVSRPLAFADEDGHGSLYYTQRRLPSSSSSLEKSADTRLSDRVAQDNAIYDVCWIKEGSQLLTASRDQTVKIWSVENRKCLGVLSGHIGSVKSLSRHCSNPELIVSGSRDGSFALWDLRCEGEACLISSAVVKEAHSPRRGSQTLSRAKGVSTGITSVLNLKDDISIATPVKRARSLSPPGRFDSVQRKRPRVEEASSSKADMASTLPDDVLLEVFKRLPPPATIFRCAAVCRRWRRVVSRASACCLPAPPRHFGFFRNYGPSPLPPFVPTAGIDLDLGFLPVSPACGAILVGCRSHRLLLRELGVGFETELRLLVCNPLEKTFARLPPLPVGRHRVSCYAVIPGEGAAFRVVIVLFGDASPNFYVLVYNSASSAWDAATGPLKRPLIPHQGPSVVIGDVVYRLQCEDKYIMAVNTAKMSLSPLPLPNAGMPLYGGNNWIGKTEDDRLCFFAIQEPLVLVKWVLDVPGKWIPQEPLPLRPLLNPTTVGDLHSMSLSAKIADQLNGCKLVSFGGFCEGSGTLFFIMAGWVVALNLKTLKMEKLWSNTDESRPLGDVFPYEMVAWPPAIKDSVKALLLDEV